MKRYPIAETFFSVQGEGVHAGRSAFFIRLFGCNVKCLWCDSRAAWDGEEPHSFETAVSLADSAKRSGASFVVITGGEPCLHNLQDVISEIKKHSIPVHLETSGTLPLQESENLKFDWVALSPKLSHRPLPENIARADELKLIVSDIQDMRHFEEIADSAPNAKAIWLHPEWSKSQDKRLLADMCEFVKSRAGKYRVGWQIHKNYFIR